MAKLEIVIPAMGEDITEATITNLGTFGNITETPIIN